MGWLTEWLFPMRVVHPIPPSLIVFRGEVKYDDAKVNEAKASADLTKDYTHITEEEA